MNATVSLALSNDHGKKERKKERTARKEGRKEGRKEEGHGIKRARYLFIKWTNCYQLAEEQDEPLTLQHNRAAVFPYNPEIMVKIQQAFKLTFICDETNHLSDHLDFFQLEMKDVLLGEFVDHFLQLEPPVTTTTTTTTTTKEFSSVRHWAVEDV